mgnify:CR=1 FL=1
MKLTVDSVNEITPDLRTGVGSNRVVMAHAADEADAVVRETSSFLRQTCRFQDRTPVVA